MKTVTALMVATILAVGLTACEPPPDTIESEAPGIEDLEDLLEEGDTPQRAQEPIEFIEDEALDVPTSPSPSAPPEPVQYAHPMVASRPPVPGMEHIRYELPEGMPRPPAEVPPIPLSEPKDILHPSVDPEATDSISRTGFEVSEHPIHLQESARSSCDNMDSASYELVDDTTAYPWRKIVKLQMRWGNQWWACSGVILDPNFVLTAGHCVFSHMYNDWADEVVVIPGMDGSFAPFGQTWGDKFYSKAGWTQDQAYSSDIALVRLANPIGYQTGTLGYGAFSDSQLEEWSMHTAGYPGITGMGDQMIVDFGPTGAVTKNLICSEVDTCSGQSGSPLWVTLSSPDDRYVTSTLSGSGGFCSPNKRFVRITTERFQWMQETFDDCSCSSGPCCDGCSFRTSDHVCDSQFDLDHRCENSGCGADAQRRYRVRYCSGSSPSCTGSKEWKAWQDIDSCGSGEVCSSDDASYATCEPCAMGCALGSCCLENGPEVCDGKDNDCDGQVDENLGKTLCGLGVCQHLAENCILGVPQLCDPLEGAQVEVCDGLDNDCDGETDESLGSTTCGQGQCEHTIQTCVTGKVQYCDPLLGYSAEVCDGLDNDCDGKTDEVLGTTTCGLGQCEHTIQTCVGGSVQLCDPTEGASVEACDGMDNDCDGETDEALGTTTCGLGHCEHTIQACVAGEIRICDPMEGTQVEVCDGMDNDCDGQVDEGMGTYLCGLGQCEQTIQSCVDGVLQSCDPKEGASTEVCDNLDNDCDGVVDEDRVCDLSSPPASTSQADVGPPTLDDPPDDVPGLWLEEENDDGQSEAGCTRSTAGSPGVALLFVVLLGLVTRLRGKYRSREDHVR